MQALAVPVLKSTLFAAAAVAALVLVPHKHHHAHHHLVLHAEANPHALYLTQWQDGPLELDVEVGHLQPLSFEMRAEVSDGCRWRGAETLTPIGADRYAYSYSEQKLSCVPHPIETVMTPRTGWVEVVAQ